MTVAQTGHFQRPASQSIPFPAISKNLDLRMFAYAVFLMGGRSREQAGLRPAASGLEMEVGSKLQDSLFPLLLLE